MDDLIENEHALNSPELIGDDNDKINCIRYWSEIVGLLRSLNVTVVSHSNKFNIIDAIKKELELIETELRNDPSYPVKNSDGSTDMEQLPADAVVDLSKSEPTPIQQAQAAKIQRNNLDRLKRAAGIDGQTS